MARPRHPDKDIERAVQYALSLGWELRMSNGHAWGRLFCPLKDREGCRLGVWSTPRNPESHARHIQREIENCPHLHQGIGPDPLEDEDDGNQDAV